MLSQLSIQWTCSAWRDLLSTRDTQKKLNLEFVQKEWKAEMLFWTRTELLKEVISLDIHLKVEIFKHGKDFYRGLHFLATLHEILSRLEPWRGSFIPRRRICTSQILPFSPLWFCWGKNKIIIKASYVSQGWKNPSQIDQFCKSFASI